MIGIIQHLDDLVRVQLQLMVRIKSSPIIPSQDRDRFDVVHTFYFVNATDDFALVQLLPKCS